jgi:protein ImuB
MQLGGTPMTKMPELYACIYAREFPVQALLRLRPDIQSQACVALEGEPPLQTVCSLTPRARALGAEHGMTCVELDTLPPLRVLTRARKQEEGARTALLECAGTFSPRVEDRSTDTAFIAVIDIAGTDKLFGAPDQLAAMLLRRVQGLGISAVAAVSSNFHVAVCLAKGLSQKSRIQVVPRSGEQNALGPLPLTVLDLSESHAETFALWGINSLGMLANLPERELVARMGQEGRRLRQLARGESPHLFQPLEPAFALEERIELDSPVELLDSLMFVAGVMLEQLVLRAESRLVALACVTISLSLEGGATHSRTVRPALPSNDRHLWLKLLHLDLEGHPPPAAILSLTLTAEPGSTSKVQLGLFSPQMPEPGRLDITLARIAKIVGEGNVGRAVLRDTHHPEGFRMERFVVPSNEPRETPAASTNAVLRALRPAESIHLTLTERGPERLRFRQENYVVERAFGPWAARGEWWNSGAWGREQWDVVARCDNGSVLYGCLVRDLMLNRWQMVGLYD